MSDFQTRLSRLRNDLITQGDRVVGHTLRSIECLFELDGDGARAVIDQDEVIDRADVEIERASIPLLALGETDPHSIRWVLTVVKVNNEFERIADCAVNIAETIADFVELDQKMPQTFQVMANSVVGMLRDANRALATSDVELAERVLAFDDTVDQFKNQIFMGVEKRVAEGTFPVRFAFRLRTVTAALERIADHCTNICEQLIYVESGRIVRHLPEGWTKPSLPE